MPLVLAIEPDPRQASVLERVVKRQVRAELVLVDSKDAALAALAARIPDVILVTALLPPRDEDEITGYLKTVPRAGHVQTLAIPLLADADPQPSLGRRLFNPLRRKTGRAATTDACAPAMFAEQVQAYLQRAAENREEVQPAEEVAAAPAVAAVAVPEPAVAEPTAPEPVVEFAGDALIADRLAELVAEASAPPPLLQLAAHATPEPVTELVTAPAAAGPNVEAVAEPLAMEAVAEVVAEPVPMEPVVEVVAEPIPMEPVLEVAAEPPATEPVTEVAPERSDTEDVMEVIAERLVAGPIGEVLAELPVSEPVTEAAAESFAAEYGVDVVAERLAAEPIGEVLAEPPVTEQALESIEEAQVEAVAEPDPAENLTPRIWDGASPLPGMMAFQMFLADSREESAVRGYQLRRASSLGAHLLADYSVVEESVPVDEPAAEPARTEPFDTSLWDNLFVALEERFQQDKARVASTAAAAAQQARKHAQARKAGRHRTRKPDAAMPPVSRGGQRSGSPLDSLRSDIERLLRKKEQPSRAPRASSDGAGDDAKAESRPVVEQHAPAPRAAQPARAAKLEPQNLESAVHDEWGFYDPDSCGFAALIARLDAQDEKAAREGAERTSLGGAPVVERDDASRIAPLAVWAHAVDPEESPDTPVPFAPLGDAARTDPALRLPDDVVAVRYASGCRIGEVRVPERPAEPGKASEKPVVLLSKKLLKKPR